MPKKVSENQKKEMIDGFINGTSIDKLSEKFNCTKLTIIRHLKKGIGENGFKSRILINNSKENKVENKVSKNLFSESVISPSDLVNDSEIKDQFLDSSFIEIAPLNYEFENLPQKDLSSVLISEVDLPKTAYMVVDKKIELETKQLKDYPEWQFLSESELGRKTIEIFFDMKKAKCSCGKEQKVIKVPNTDVFKIVAPILLSRGISRIVSTKQLISL